MSDEAAGSSTGQLHDVSARLAEVRRAADPHGVFTPGR
jgi:hypothetical protein